MGLQNHYPDLGDWFCHALNRKQLLRRCGSAALRHLCHSKGNMRQVENSCVDKQYLDITIKNEEIQPICTLFKNKFLTFALK